MAKINPLLRKEIYARDGGKCLQCGSDYNLTIDHVVPISRGGKNIADNMQTMCAPCNVKKGSSDKVFPNLVYGGWQNGILLKWMREAGILKHITFHCFRHSYATLQLTLGTDIYTVSKMLGHSSVSMTQIYAKVIDQKKQDAANKISFA